MPQAFWAGTLNRMVWKGLSWRCQQTKAWKPWVKAPVMRYLEKEQSRWQNRNLAMTLSWKMLSVQGALRRLGEGNEQQWGQRISTLRLDGIGGLSRGISSLETSCKNDTGCFMDNRQVRGLTREQAGRRKQAKVLTHIKISLVRWWWCFRPGHGEVEQWEVRFWIL